MSDPFKFYVGQKVKEKHTNTPFIDSAFGDNKITEGLIRSINRDKNTADVSTIGGLKTVNLNLVEPDDEMPKYEIGIGTRIPNQYLPAFSLPMSQVSDNKCHSTIMYGSPGLSKLELFTLEILKARVSTYDKSLDRYDKAEIIDDCIEFAKQALKQLEDDAKQGV